METNDILVAIDQQITQLQQARALLVGNESMGALTGKRRGRPKGSVNQATKASAPVAANSGKRTMSPEGRARVARCAEGTLGGTEGSRQSFQSGSEGPARSRKQRRSRRHARRKLQRPGLVAPLRAVQPRHGERLQRANLAPKLHLGNRPVALTVEVSSNCFRRKGRSC